jgi:hypothetical protein
VENLQLWPTFPDKRLIKTYDALWESCRSIAPLQLLFLEIFNLIGTFWSYAISKQAKWNEKRTERALDLQSRACHVPCTPCSGVWSSRTHRCGPALDSGPSAWLFPCEPRPGTRRGHAAGLDGHAPMRRACRASLRMQTSRLAAS